MPGKLTASEWQRVANAGLLAHFCVGQRRVCKSEQLSLSPSTLSGKLTALQTRATSSVSTGSGLHRYAFRVCVADPRLAVDVLVAHQHVFRRTNRFWAKCTMPPISQTDNIPASFTWVQMCLQGHQSHYDKCRFAKRIAADMCATAFVVLEEVLDAPVIML